MCDVGVVARILDDPAHRLAGGQFLGGPGAKDLVDTIVRDLEEAVTTSATPRTTIAPPSRVLVVTCSSRMIQPRNTATTGFTYA